MRQTVGQYLEAWLGGVRGQVRGSTFATYQYAVRRLTPLIGRVELQSLTRNQVKAAYQALTESGRAPRAGQAGGGALSAKTVHNTHLALRRALKRRGERPAHCE